MLLRPSRGAAPRRWSLPFLLLLGGAVAAIPACTEELGEGACETPGNSQKCTCADGRGSVQTCSAEKMWEPCYCYRAGCGNGELDPDEECDDANTSDGDGCRADCTLEPGGPGAGGASTSSGNGGATTSSGNGGATTTSTTTTSVTTGGGMGGAGGAGGNGGTAGAGG